MPVRSTRKNGSNGQGNTKHSTKTSTGQNQAAKATVNSTPPAKPTVKKGSVAITMTAHNSAHILPRSLASTQWANQLVFVDCASYDDSLTLAKGFTHHVYSQPNRFNLNINKAYAIAKANTEWVFYLDSDEVISPELALEIQARIANNPRENAFLLPRRNYYYNRWLRHGSQYPDHQLRLFRKAKGQFACQHLHEKLHIEGKIGKLNQALIHYTCSTPLEALRKLDFNSTFEAKIMLDKKLKPSVGLALRYVFLKPAHRFVNRWLLKGGFLDGWAGFVQAVLGSIDFVLRFVKFWCFHHFPQSLQTEINRLEKN